MAPPDRRTVVVEFPVELHARLVAAAGRGGMSRFVRDAVEARLAEVENGEASLPGRAAEEYAAAAAAVVPSMSEFVAELAGVADAVDLEERVSFAPLADDFEAEVASAHVVVAEREPVRLEVPEGTCPHCGSIKSLLVIGSRRRCLGCGAMFGGYGP